MGGERIDLLRSRIGRADIMESLPHENDLLNWNSYGRPNDWDENSDSEFLF